MLTARDVAMYFISKDKDGTLFNKKVVEKNGRKFYEGNARLNKYLHLAQNIYLAKTGEPLFHEKLYAYDNGAVVPVIQENYAVLLERTKEYAVNLREEEKLVKSFLDVFYKVCENATLDELIELSHEDEEWIAKHEGYTRKEQEMDNASRKEEYAVQYADMVRIMEGMGA